MPMVAELRDTSVVANMVTVVAAQILLSGWKCHCSSGYLGIWVWGSTTDLFALLRASMDICMLWSTMRMVWLCCIGMTCQPSLWSCMKGVTCPRVCEDGVS